MTVAFDESHIKDAAEAEKLCFSVPWSEASLAMLTHEPCFGVVSLVDGKFAAYGGIMCVADEAQILNVATLPEYRRRGLAKEILSALYNGVRERGAITVTREVRESNIAARSLYTSEGFTETGLRPNYYQNPREAAIIMEKKL